MRRPGTAGMLILLAFAVVFAVEFNTLLGMFGFDIAPGVYFPVMGLVILAVFSALLLFPKNKGKASAGV
jgi:hypothetical protein